MRDQVAVWYKWEDFRHATAAVDSPMHLTTCSLRKNNKKRCCVDFGLPHQCIDAPASSRYDQNVRVWVTFFTINKYDDIRKTCVSSYVPCIYIHNITLHYITLDLTTLDYIALPYLTLRYIIYRHTYIHTYVHTYALTSIQLHTVTYKFGFCEY